MEGLINGIGIPVVIICVVMVLLCIASMAWAFGSHRGENRKYTLDQKWDRGPLLFSAVDSDPVALATHGHNESADDLLGGSAHAKW